MVAVVALVVLVILYQFQLGSGLKSSVVKSDVMEYGYDYDSLAGTSSLGDSFPDFSSIVDGLPEKRYFVNYGEQVILDGLLMPIQVPQLSTPVKWTQDSGDSQAVQIENDTAARTFFMAPREDTVIKILLESELGGTTRKVANYVFQVMSPIAMSADVNKDGKYNLEDLTNLLQNWDQYGVDSLKILAVILSNYE